MSAVAVANNKCYRSGQRRGAPDTLIFFPPFKVPFCENFFLFAPSRCRLSSDYFFFDVFRTSV
jgi:hypothetical protein